MAKQSNKKVIATKLLIILVLGIVLGISCFFSKPIENFLGIGAKPSNYIGDKEVSADDLSIHYIDVGQGDSTLILLPDNTTMLIDAGTSKSGTHIVDYLKNLEVSTIDYFILTHSDADHVGSAAKVLETFDVKTIYRPFQISVDKNGNATEDEDLSAYLDLPEYQSKLNLISTATYKNFITAAYNEVYGNNIHAEVVVHHDGIQIESTKAGTQFMFEFFAPIIRNDTPISTYAEHTSGYPTKYYGKGTAESKNAASPVMLLEYKDNAFVFTGDATDDVEHDFLDSLTDPEKARFENVDVFQAGHHGSDTSNSQELLDLIVPSYTLVSCGANNKYGHPTEGFVNKIDALNHRGIPDYLLRTDTMGDITFGYYEGTLVYKAVKAGVGTVVRWWYIALGTFIVLSIVVLSVKVSKNKATTAKRFVKQTEKVSKSISKKK